MASLGVLLTVLLHVDRIRHPGVVGITLLAIDGIRDPVSELPASGNRGRLALLSTIAR